MLEILTTKYLGVTKITPFSLLIMTTFNSHNGFWIKRNETKREDDVPGDNFPYAVMNPHRVH